MITYRSFRNWDPPGLVEIWNSGAKGRGIARSICVLDLDRLVFSKPYFDPSGLILALDGSRAVGFVHAGFGATEDDAALCREFGVITMLVVVPEYRRRGIARELVRHAEAYLRARGSTVIYAGAMHPLDPFYHGLYGGSEMPGILHSDAEPHHLFRSLRYRPVDECVVFQRALNGPMLLADPRLRTWARETEFTINPEPPTPTWWSACRYSSLDQVGFELRLNATGRVAARASGWEMYPLDRTWGAAAVGIVGVDVQPEYRNQGLGTFLMTQILRHYRDNGAALVEVQTMARNAAACKLYLRLGFSEVDRGVIYRADAAGEPVAGRQLRYSP